MSRPERGYPERGYFVSIDGMGGAGKSTTTGLLRELLTERGHDVHATTQPSHDQLGALARYNTAIYSGHALACLVAADRYHHLRQIRFNLEAGNTVICDRYIPSSYVLQRRDGVPLRFIEAVNADADTPDLAVILTADPEVTAQRIGRRGAHNRFETGVESSRAEADLYRDTAVRLAERGWPLLTIDTSHTDPRIVAEIISDDITRRLPHS